MENALETVFRAYSVQFNKKENQKDRAYGQAN